MTELVIRKYVLKHGYRNPIEMPKGAEVLCIKKQHKEATIWALVNPDNPSEKRLFILKETGSPFQYKARRGTESHKYIGTVLSEDQTYEYHCFEVLGD